MRKRGTQVGRAQLLAMLCVAVVLMSLVAHGVTLGNAKITLQSHKYYRKWDLTRLVYRIKDSSAPWDSWWVLGVGDCVTDDVLEAYASSRFTWVDEPFRGLRFERSKKNEKFYVWLIGQWDVAETDVALVVSDRHGAATETYLGTVDGPACEGGSIAVETIGGGSVQFPALDGPGAYEAESRTILRVTSSSAGWGLSHSIGFSIPSSASESVVAGSLIVSYDAYDTSAGVTDVGVSYTMEISEDDFAGLPEGAYVIEITYTASTD